jgi:hypothetical protein
MENRGSKSDFKVIPKFVKEQRVNGSWCIKKPLMHLRCTLTGFERNYRIKILSNQIRFSLFREFSSKSFQSSIKNPALEIKSCALHPWFITGFVDASNNKSLIVWGTNLKSTVGYKLSPKELAKVQLAPYQYNVIIGLLLSDGWLIFGGARSKNARLGFAQSEDNGKYFWFVFWCLSHYCSSNPKKRIRTKFGKETVTSGWEFFTRSMPCFTELHSLFYVNKVKVIPDNIYDILTPVALAHLIMGDGSAHENGLYICTDSYNVTDVVRLINVFIIKYRLECNLNWHRPTQPRIYIKSRSMNLLDSIVRPHFHSSMLYKLGKEVKAKNQYCTSSLSANDKS